MKFCSFHNRPFRIASIINFVIVPSYNIIFNITEFEGVQRGLLVLTKFEKAKKFAEIHKHKFNNIELQYRIITIYVMLLN